MSRSERLPIPIRALDWVLGRTLTLHKQNSARHEWVGDVLGPDVSEEDISHFEPSDLLRSFNSYVHIECPVQHSKHFFTVVHMPDVRLIGPVNFHRGTIDFGDELGIPRFLAYNSVARITRILLILARAPLFVRSGPASWALRDPLDNRDGRLSSQVLRLIP